MKYFCYSDSAVFQFICAVAGARDVAPCWLCTSGRGELHLSTILLSGMAYVCVQSLEALYRARQEEFDRREAERLAQAEVAQRQLRWALSSRHFALNCHVRHCLSHLTGKTCRSYSKLLIRSIKRRRTFSAYFATTKPTDAYVLIVALLSFALHKFFLLRRN